MRSEAAVFVVLVMLVASSFLLITTPWTAASTDARSTSGGTGMACKVPMAIPPSSKVRVALVNSILTSSAYSNVSYPGVKGFYNFYMKYKSTPNGSSVRTDLSWLTVPLAAPLAFFGGWGNTYHIYRFMSSDFAVGCGLRRFSILNDVQVDSGSLMSPNGSRRLDVVVMGKSEYVTSNELNQYATFVRAGGRLVLMDSDNFEVQVRLDYCAGLCETFVNGHGWTFEQAMVRTRAWNAFRAMDMKLTGSLLPEHYYSATGIGPGRVNDSTLIGRMLHRAFGPTVLSNYSAHEESRLVNKTGTSVVIGFSLGISSYVHRYGLGDVVCFCLEGSRIIGRDATAKYFLILAISSWGSDSKAHRGGATIGNGIAESGGLGPSARPARPVIPRRAGLAA